MSDFFARLVARHQGREQGLRVRLPGLFESESGATEGFVEEVEERTAAPPVARPQRPPQVSPPPQATSVLPESTTESLGSSTRRDSPGLRESLIVERETRVEAQRELREVKAETHVREKRVTHADHYVETRFLTERVHDAPDAPAPPAHDRAPPREVVEPPPESPGLAPPRAESAPLPVPRVERLPEPPDPAAETPVPLAPPQRRVEVHIGHLEIRQAAAVKPQPRKRVSPANPAPDLGSYLNGRRQ